MAGLTGTQALLIVIIILLFFSVFMRQRRPEDPWRPRPGWWPERRALREYEDRR